MTRRGPLPDLASLAVFVDAVEHGSITRAAEESGISQPSASARLRQLERQLGVALLERSPSGVRPTDAGRVLSGWALEVLHATDRLVAGAGSLGAARRASLHVAASFTIAELLMPAWLGELHATRPDLRATLEVRNSAGVQELVLGDADIEVGFVEGPEVDRRLAAQVVDDDVLVVVVDVTHPWRRRRRPIGAEQLARTALVLREPGSGTRESLLRTLRDRGVEPRVALELGSTAAVLRAVYDGVGPTVISSRAAAAEVAAGRLHEVPTEGLDLRRQLRAVWRKGVRLGPGARALLAIAGR
ncbi:MAG: LysR family transcriptional regulator [Acidimicrobiia bacterium]